MVKPIIYREGFYSKESINELIDSNEGLTLKSLRKTQLNELFEIRNPQNLSKKDFKESRAKYVRDHTKDDFLRGDWIYYPWTKLLLHSVKESELYELRTSRNRNIISSDEQITFSNFSVGIAGLSVGSNIALNLSHMMTSHFKLADFDFLETTNLNRVRAKLADVNEPKIDILARNLYEINPYVNLDLFPEGVTAHNIDEFMGGSRPPQVIFEILDDFKLKIQLRVEARKRGIPVIMMTNLGDRVLIDIERYDKDKKLPIFNGQIGNTPEDILRGNITLEDEKNYALRIVGLHNTPERVIESVKQIGVTLAGRPQLLSTTSVSSGIAAYIVRTLATDPDKIKSGRLLYSIEDILA